MFLTYNLSLFSGEVTQSVANGNTVANWVMNRPYQTKFAQSLMDISGLSTTTSNPRKCLRSIEILKSNTMVEKIMLVYGRNLSIPFSRILIKASCSTWCQDTQHQ